MRPKLQIRFGFTASQTINGRVFIKTKITAPSIGIKSNQKNLDHDMHIN